MKNKWIILAGAVALTAFSTAQATPITGSIAMNGTVTLNSTYLGSASATTGYNNVQVAGLPSGSFFATPSLVNDAVTWHNFSFSGGSASPLWSFSDAGTGWTYTFNLANDYVVAQSDGYLNLGGTGSISITGVGSSYVTTPGVWSFTITSTEAPGSDFSFSFANSQTAVVPDGGATVMLLGAALSALGLFRKKLIA
jgi:hypothetical protein